MHTVLYWYVFPPRSFLSHKLSYYNTKVSHRVEASHLLLVLFLVLLFFYTAVFSASLAS